MNASREIQFKGHLIDSMIFPKVLGKIMDMEGEFEILQFDIGKHKTDYSYARILIIGKNEEHLERILLEMHKLGGCLPDIEDVQLKEAIADKVIPKGFYSTTNHPTFIRHMGKWLPVENIAMDRMIVVHDNMAVCTPISNIKKGDKIAIGERGIRVVPTERPREHSLFEFMGGGTSSERPSLNLIKQIAKVMVNSKNNGGKIAVVAGPAIVHTGAASALAEIIKKGYVDVLLTGNALAVHDIEYSLYKTSLGMDLENAEPVPGGHRHHIYAISEVTACGSIKNAVEQGVIKSGIMYECIKNKVHFVLAGSIRDDGPLPDVITDTVKAKDAMYDAIKDIEVVLMMATTLHSIATGNLLPSYVKTICVDINPSSVIKLMDRGTAQAIGVVTDVGTFLPMLAEQLKTLN